MQVIESEPEVKCLSAAKKRYKMIFRLDSLSENNINPITGYEYDSSRMIFMLTDSLDYQQMCGSINGCAYMIKTTVANNSRNRHLEGDLI